MDELTNVIKNKKEQLNEIVKNISKMFIKRGYINEPLDDETVEKLIQNKVIYLDELNLSINIIDSIVKNISSGSNLDEYLSNKVNYKKIIIAKEFSKKVYKQINNIYSNAEIFFMYEFLDDITSKDFIPEHVLLNADEKEELLKLFSYEELSKIHDTDIMARYYGAKVNDIFKIVRININSGFSTVYRTVIPGSLDNLFL